MRGLLIAAMLWPFAAMAADAPPPALEQRLTDRLLTDISNYESAYAAERRQNQIMQTQSAALAEWWAAYVRGLQHAETH
jgi:hypothetical protein